VVLKLNQLFIHEVGVRFGNKVQNIMM